MPPHAFLIRHRFLISSTVPLNLKNCLKIYFYPGWTCRLTKPLKRWVISWPRQLKRLVVLPSSDTWRFLSWRSSFWRCLSWRCSFCSCSSCRCSSWSCSSWRFSSWRCSSWRFSFCSCSSWRCSSWINLDVPTWRFKLPRCLHHVVVYSESILHS